MKIRLPFKEKITFNCIVCGVSKTVYSNPNQSFKYCSTYCYQKHRGAVTGGKVEITCKRCGITKIVPHKEVLQGRHKYCSKSCAAIDFGTIPPQEHNHICNYRGFKFRSKGEVRYAEWCDYLGIDWLYEPMVFKLTDCSYIPDFYLPKFDKWVEIKYTVNDKETKTTEFGSEHSLEILFKKDLDKLRKGVGVNG